VLSALFHRRDVAFTAAALVVLGGVWGVPRSLAAGDSVRLQVAGPKVLTTPSTYRIALRGNGGDKVCRVQETASRASDSKAPFTLPVGPDALKAGRGTLTFQAVGCDNALLGTAKLTVEVPVHVVSAGAYVAPDSVEASLRRFALTVKAEKGPLRARIARGRTTVSELASTDGAKGSWTWKPGPNPAGHYRAEVTAGKGASSRTLVVPFTITSGWAPLGKPFPRCRLLTWSYDGTGEPGRAHGISKDVATAFTRISKATGIRFQHVNDHGTIELGWKDMGADGPDGEGGAFWSGASATSGKVVFNTRSTWVGKAGFARYANDFPGRGALVTHEIGHALGLGHVTDSTQVMFPVATDGSPLGLRPGDRAGLNALYHAKSC
jgi:matrixin